MAERVQLRDRPGSFFVVCRVLNQVRLLDASDREFTVAADQVVTRSPLRQAARSVQKRIIAQTAEYAQYGELIEHLLSHREQVHIYFYGWGRARERIQDRYLELTGEELPEHLVYHEPESSWEAPKASIMMPTPPHKFLTPRPVRSTDRGCIMQDLKFTWFLIATHGFRVTRKYLLNEEGRRCPVTP